MNRKIVSCRIFQHLSQPIGLGAGLVYRIGHHHYAICAEFFERLPDSAFAIASLTQCAHGGQQSTNSPQGDDREYERERGKEHRLMGRMSE
jgi:hypothetical protein